MPSTGTLLKAYGQIPIPDRSDEMTYQEACLVYAGLQISARIMGKVHDAIIEGGKTAGL